MALDYQGFKDYVKTYLWRDNDVDLINNLDVLISQADTELTQLTRDFNRRQNSAVIQPETEDFDLAANVPDFESIQSLTSNNTGGYYNRSQGRFTQTTLSNIYGLRAQHPGIGIMPFYCIGRQGGTLFLRLVGSFSAENPGDLTMVYRSKIPDFQTDDASWFADEYLSLYLYTVMKHCALFLREDERVQAYKALQQEAYLLADEDDKHNLQFGGSPMRMQPHRTVP